MAFAAKNGQVLKLFASDSFVGPVVNFQPIGAITHLTAIPSPVQRLRTHGLPVVTMKIFSISVICHHDRAILFDFGCQRLLEEQLDLCQRGSAGLCPSPAFASRHLPATCSVCLGALDRAAPLPSRTKPPFWQSSRQLVCLGPSQFFALVRSHWESEKVSGKV